MSTLPEPLPLIELNDPLFTQYGVELFLYPLYLNHPTISGNKWFKLKYNLQEAKKLGQKTILTFGGAWSNHIYATAAACKEFGFSSIGIIRGEPTPELNSVLTFAENCGMQLHFIDRTSYKNKESQVFIRNLHQQFGEFYLVPEGGSNFPGVKGCMEIMNNIGDFNYVCCSCGTGATLAGITLSLKPDQKAIGFSALKGGEFLKEEVNRFRKEQKLEMKSAEEQFIIQTNYHFGGYAKSTSELIDFVKHFERQHTIPLDRVYTSKMMFGIYDLIGKGFFQKGEKIIAVHTGGVHTSNPGKEINQ